MDLDDVAAEIELAQGQIDHPIVVGISGFAGSGKSTLARLVVERLPDAVRMRGDDFLDPVRSHQRSSDWDGVDRIRLVRDVLQPFRERRDSTFQRFDWNVRALGAYEAVPRAGIMIVDLIGLFHPETEGAIDVRIWCDVDLKTAAERGIARDARLGRRHAHLWHDVWVPNERDFVENHDPRSAADVLFTVPPSAELPAS